MKDFNRIDRVNALLKREIADILEKDLEHMEGCLVSVTEVKTSPDLRTAKVLLSILGNDEVKNKVLKSIFKKKSYIQNKVVSAVKLKYTPVLNIEIDKSVEAGDRVLSIINEIETQEKSTQNPDE